MSTLKYLKRRHEIIQLLLRNWHSWLRSEILHSHFLVTINLSVSDRFQCLNQLDGEKNSNRLNSANDDGNGSDKDKMFADQLGQLVGTSCVVNIAWVISYSTHSRYWLTTRVWNLQVFKSDYYLEMKFITVYLVTISVVRTPPWRMSPILEALSTATFKGSLKIIHCGCCVIEFFHSILNTDRLVQTCN